MLGERQPGRLDGKIALVTGAARGLGRSCAVEFARAGAHLVLLDVAANIPGVRYALGSQSQLDHTAALCNAFGAITLTVSADIRDPGRIAAAVDAAINRFGRLDVLLNGAGVVVSAGKSIHEIDEPDWQLMIDIDLSGCWRVIKAVAPTMIEQRSGSIVNIASTSGTLGARRCGSYVAAKHGVVGLSRAAALDLAFYKIRVNALCPGSVREDHRTEGAMLPAFAHALDLSSADYEEALLPDLPMNGLIEPDDVSAAALWLASDESKHVTGSVIAIDGGFGAH